MTWYLEDRENYLAKNEDMQFGKNRRSVYNP